MCVLRYFKPKSFLALEIKSCLIPKAALSLKLPQNIHAMFLKDYATTGDQITTLLQAGKIDPVIAEEFSLEKTHEAHRRIEQTLRSGGACGKLVVNLEL